MAETVAASPGHQREPSEIDFAKSKNYTFPAHYHEQSYTFCTNASQSEFGSGIRRLRPEPENLATLPSTLNPKSPKP